MPYGYIITVRSSVVNKLEYIQKNHHQPKGGPLQKCKNFKWYGLTLIPFRMQHAAKLRKLAETHLFVDGIHMNSTKFVLAHSDGIFLVVDGVSDERDDIIGCHAFLPLSQYGLRLIEFDMFDGSDIEDDAIAKNFQEAVALYWWTSIAPGRAVKSVSLVNLVLERDDFSDKPIFAKAATKRGLLSMRGLGFTSLDGSQGNVGDIFCLNYRDVSDVK